MKKIVVFLILLFVVSVNVKAIVQYDEFGNEIKTETEPDESRILSEDEPDSNVVTDENTQYTENENVTTYAADDLELYSETDSDKQEKLMLYIGIGVGVSILLAGIGYITSKKDRQIKKNNV